METLSRCRICLVSGVRMHLIINTYLQDIFEQLTSVPFQKEDGRPLFVCYICKARLKNCHEMRVNCLRSEKYFTELLNNHIKPIPLSYMNKLQIVSLTHLNCVTVAMNNVDDDVGFGVDDVKREPLEIYDVQVKEENIEVTEDNPIDEADSILNTEHKFKTEDLSIDNDIIHTADYSLFLQLKSDEQSLKDELDYNVPAAQFKDVHPTKMNSNKTSVPVAEKLNESQIITTNIPEMEVTFGTNINVKISTQELNKDAGKNIPAIATAIVDTSGDLQTTIYKCDACEKYFNQKDTLIIHTCRHTGENPYKCDTCEKGFIKKSDLLRHTLIHSGVKPYKCDICEKCFTRHSSLVQHTRIHTGEKPYRCEICKKCFSCRRNLWQHARIHNGVKPYRCDICDKCFSQQGNLVQHARLHTGEKPYRCDTCGEFFSQQIHLVQHARRHTGEKPYSCDLCKKCFSSKSSLVRHNRTHIGVKSYRCDICEKCFSYKSNLMQHARIHNGVKPYKCDICEKYFTRHSSLVQHARIHNGVKPYKCDICEKCFTRHSRLVQHARIHTGEKSYGIPSSDA